jgi:hypothetical protein
LLNCLGAENKTEVIRLDEGPVSKTGVRRGRIVGSSPTASASRNLCALGRAAEAPGFQPGQAGSTPAEHFGEDEQTVSFGDRLTAGCLPLKQVMKVRVLLPEPFYANALSIRAVNKMHRVAGSERSDGPEQSALAIKETRSQRSHGRAIEKTNAGRLLLVATPGSEPGGRWFDSSSRNWRENGSHPAG